MTAKQALGSHLNLHNMYAIHEAKATNEVLLALRGGKRPFSCSRASSTGLGQYAFHWTGDIFSTWEYMRMSIPTNLNFNLFGVPLVGSDICGFIGDTNPELCARWQALGAFYGFSRNHNTIGAVEQDPAFMGGNVLKSAMRALKMRYSLLPYLYTLFYRATEFGETVSRSLLFEFPEDGNAYAHSEEQFMWGSKVLITPVLYEGKTQADAYFPKGKWYDYQTKQLLIDSVGQVKTLDIPIDQISVTIRGGSIIPTQDPSTTTTEQRKNPFDILIALDDKNKASGELFQDDGDSQSSIVLENFSLVNFDVGSNQFTSTPDIIGYKENFVANKLTILGLGFTPKKVSVNGQTATKFSFSNNVFTIDLDNLDLTQRFTVNWS